MSPSAAFKGGPKEELSSEETQKQVSRLASSLGQRGMSQDQMMGKPELKALINGVKGSIGGAVRGFFQRLKGPKTT
ncbi:hypothetical protein H0O00_00335 [Candidatus Micrarchaeota archaeon]|nr:hypothetical protein [Candidatus Micrarchaeota archaeon]